MSGQTITRTIAGAAALCLFAIGVLWASGVKAQEPKCGPRADMVKVLGDKYHEVPVAVGMVNDQLLMETFASDAGTWTIFMTNAEKISCLFLMGKDWQWNTKAFDAAKKGEEM